MCCGSTTFTYGLSSVTPHQHRACSFISTHLTDWLIDWFTHWLIDWRLTRLSYSRNYSLAILLIIIFIFHTKIVDKCASVECLFLFLLWLLLVSATDKYVLMKMEKRMKFDRKRKSDRGKRNWPSPIWTICVLSFSIFRLGSSSLIDIDESHCANGLLWSGHKWQIYVCQPMHIWWYFTRRATSRYNSDNEIHNALRWIE